MPQSWPQGILETEVNSSRAVAICFAPAYINETQSLSPSNLFTLDSAISMQIARNSL